jgi:hypothetical protein
MQGEVGLATVYGVEITGCMSYGGTGVVYFLFKRILNAHNTSRSICTAYHLVTGGSGLRRAHITA